MFGRRELLMLVAWVGLISTLTWLAQVSSPQNNENRPPALSAASTGVPIVLQAAAHGEQHPLLPRLVVRPLAVRPLSSPRPSGRSSRSGEAVRGVLHKHCRCSACAGKSETSGHGRFRLCLA